MTKNYNPVLFQAIATEVAGGLAEQYLTASQDEGIAVMFSTPAVWSAIAQSRAQFEDGSVTDIIAFECQASHFVTANPVFTDNFKGVIEVNNVLVEVSVRKLKDGVHRVLFSRVDAEQMYSDFSARLERIEGAVRDLQSAIN